MSKKILFIAMILMVVFSLSACGSGSGETAAIAVNNPFGENGEKLVFDHDEANNIIFKNENGLSYWTLSDAGVGTLVSYEGALPTNMTTDSNGVRTYTFTVEDIEASFKIYVMPETIVGNADDVVMVVFRFGVDNVLYQIGERFDPKGIEAYAVKRGGGDPIKLHEVLDEEAFAALFNDHDYEPLSDDGFRNKYAYDVTFTYGDITETIGVYVAGGERPISTEDATFFDWVLVIPVAFVMNLFASLLGNNFAVGILFTTIVVRTIAWPIYAKSNDMSIKMNVAQPDMQRVQAKYATKKDPQSQQQMQMEMMSVYKKHGINVLGCLFPFLQMPIFIAMYGVVRRITIEGGMYAAGVANTNFLGIDLANQRDGIIGMVLAGIVGGTMFLLQKISMKKPDYVKKTASHNPNPQAAQTEKTMKFVSYFMVIMMAFASFQSNALALYWIFGNIYSLGQTLVNRKLNEKKHEALQQKQLMG